jgi:hypothetical protein
MRSTRIEPSYRYKQVMRTKPIKKTVPNYNKFAIDREPLIVRHFHLYLRLFLIHRKLRELPTRYYLIENRSNFRFLKSNIYQSLPIYPILPTHDD